jgi:LCP family protein required for cell wall assembly
MGGTPGSGGLREVEVNQYDPRMPSARRLAEPDLDERAVDDAVDSKPPASRRRPRPRRRALHVTMIVLGVLILVLGGAGVGATLYLKSVENKVKRVPAFEGIPEDTRPSKAAAAKDAQNYLVLGSDTRDPDNVGGSRSDTIILLHITKGHTGAQLVSIPRDTWAHIPRSADGKHGNTMAKINAAYAWGGVPLTVQTVEEFTGVRIDHVVMVDFAGFKEIVDALGGVDITVDEAFTSTHSLNPDSIRHFNAGPQVMDGAAALDYARERYAFKDGDFARIRHQQQVIKAILDKAASGDLLTNPGHLNAFLKATANAVAVDSTLNLVDTAMDLRHLRSGDLVFYTNPSRGTGKEGAESVVYADRDKDKLIYSAIAQDQPIPLPPG